MRSEIPGFPSPLIQRRQMRHFIGNFQWAMCGRCVGDVWAMCGRCVGNVRAPFACTTMGPIPRTKRTLKVGDVRVRLACRRLLCTGGALRHDKGGLTEQRHGEQLQSEPRDLRVTKVLAAAQS